MANFSLEFLSLVFAGLQAPHKIHAQNSRPKLLALLSNFTCLNPKDFHADFLLTRETNTNDTWNRMDQLVGVGSAYAEEVDQ